MKKDPKDRMTDEDALFLDWMTGAGGRARGEHPLPGGDDAPDPRLRDEDALFEQAMRGRPADAPARPGPSDKPVSATAPHSVPKLRDPDMDREDDVFLRTMGALPAEPTAPRKERRPREAAAVSVTPRTLLRRVRHGQVAPERTLNLHGLRRDEALRSVASFVRTCRAEGLRLVLVITGRGLHSKSEPVLRHEVPQWLRIDCAGDVQEVVKAPPELGREGALLVVLRPIRPDGEQAPEREPD